MKDRRILVQLENRYMSYEETMQWLVYHNISGFYFEYKSIMYLITDDSLHPDGQLEVDPNDFYAQDFYKSENVLFAKLNN